MSLSNFEVVPGVRVGRGERLLVLAGPCVAESLEVCCQIAETAKAVCADLGIDYVFKASFDKANRTSINGFRGPGLKAGLEMLATVKQKYEVPVVTDVHEPFQCEPVAEVADILQIPAFLCRQTDLLLAAAKTGRPVNVKKGQFLAPEDMAAVVKKLESTGNERILLTDRGTTFGYHNLVVDMRGLAIMRGLGCPVVFDATHSVQLPGGNGTSSGGNREFVAPLARAAAAVGIDALFLEIHPEPSKALSDGANSLALKDLRELLTVVKAIHEICP
ncbi:MAG: 3-deoxy-8-phosphooctulonate synthase [Victivallales bacterium]|nr:3-deoxy-8-phosphooctulonate synthase [Victivallales bacterium]